jgi:5-methylcytosine-specific restriction endonuclease McrA
MLPAKISTTVRRAVYARDGHACILCGDGRAVHIHHHVPRSRGGKSTLGNLVCLCPVCHSIAHGQYQLANQFPFDRETACDAIHYYLEYQ